MPRVQVGRTARRLWVGGLVLVAVIGFAQPLGSTGGGSARHRPTHAHRHLGSSRSFAGLVDRGVAPPAAGLDASSINVGWNQLEPNGPGLIADNPIDQAIAAAACTPARIRVLAGIATPEWVTDQTGSVNVTNPYSNTAGVAGDFWTPEYQTLYDNLESELAAAYEGVPNIAGVRRLPMCTVLSGTVHPRHIDRDQRLEPSRRRIHGSPRPAVSAGRDRHSERGLAHDADRGVVQPVSDPRRGEQCQGIHGRSRRDLYPADDGLLPLHARAAVCPRERLDQGPDLRGRRHAAVLQRDVCGDDRPRRPDRVSDRDSKRYRRFLGNVGVGSAATRRFGGTPAGRHVSDNRRNWRSGMAEPFGGLAVVPGHSDLHRQRGDRDSRAVPDRR